MPKPVILILSGLASFLILVGVFYYISIRYCTSQFLRQPDANEQSTNLWIIIFGVPAALSAGLSGWFTIFYTVAAAADEAIARPAGC